MKYSDLLWQQIAPTYQKIIHHPFNVELTRGTLNQEQFVFYMEQDAYYLVRFSQALALIAGRADSSKTTHQFLNFALEALVTERELHMKFLPSHYACDSIEPSPACLAYTQHLIATAAIAPIEEAIAAVLPCFWIYREVGNTIAAHAEEENPYISWINTYSSKEFSEGTDRAIQVLDEVASYGSKNALARMKTAFEYSTLYEWLFWDDAYHMNLFRETPFQNCLKEF